MLYIYFFFVLKQIFIQISSLQQLLFQFSTFVLINIYIILITKITEI